MGVMYSFGKIEELDSRLEDHKGFAQYKNIIKLNRDFVPSINRADSGSNVASSGPSNVLITSNNKKPSEMQQVRTDIEAILFPSFPFGPTTDSEKKLAFINQIALDAKKKERNYVLERDSRKRRRHLARNLLTSHAILPKIDHVNAADRQEDEIINARYSNHGTARTPALVPTESIVEHGGKLTKTIRYVRRPMKLPPIRLNEEDPRDSEEHKEYFDWLNQNYFEDLIPVTAVSPSSSYKNPFKEASPLEEIYKFEILLNGQTEAKRHLKQLAKNVEKGEETFSAISNNPLLTTTTTPGANNTANLQRRKINSEEFNEMDRIAHSPVPKGAATVTSRTNERIRKRLQKLRNQSKQRQKMTSMRLIQKSLIRPLQPIPKFLYERAWRAKKLPKSVHYSSLNHILDKNPSLIYPIIQPAQLEQGLINLMQRGLIPKNADFTPTIELSNSFTSGKAEINQHPFSTVFYSSLKGGGYDDPLRKFKNSVMNRSAFMKQMNAIKTGSVAGESGGLRKSKSFNLNLSSMNLDTLVVQKQSDEFDDEDDPLNATNDSVIRNLVLSSISVSDLSPTTKKPRRDSRIMSIVREHERMDPNTYAQNKLVEQIKELEQLRVDNPFVKFESIVSVIQKQKMKNLALSSKGVAGNRQPKVSINLNRRRGSIISSTELPGEGDGPKQGAVESDGRIYDTAMVTTGVDFFEDNAKTPCHTPDEHDDSEEGVGSSSSSSHIRSFLGDNQNKKYVTSGGVFTLNTMVTDNEGTERSLSLTRRTSSRALLMPSIMKQVSTMNAFEQEGPQFPRDTLLKVEQNAKGNANNEIREFLIANGKLIESLPPFIAFREKNKAKWGSFLVLLRDMEELFTRYAVSMAQIDCNKLEVAANRYYMDKVKPDILTSCLINQIPVEKTMKQVGQRFKGKDGQLIAITKIQATYRMYSWRKWYLWQLTRRAAAATFIHFYTANKLKFRVRQKMEAKRKQMLIDSPILQQKFSENWDILRNHSNKKIILHFPANALWSHWRERDRRNASTPLPQMSRLLDLTDPNATVIMVIPKEIDEQYLKFYMNILESHDAKDLENRLIWVYPDTYHCYPTDAPAVSSLSTSTDTLKDLVEKIADQPSYMVPGVSSAYDMNISTRLNVPFLAPTPELTQMLLHKVGARKIFEEANVYHPPGSFLPTPTLDIIAAEILKMNEDYPQYPRWLLKINTDSGHGFAYIDSSMIPKKYAESILTGESHNDLTTVTNREQQIKDFSAIILESLSLVYPMFYTMTEEYLYYAEKFGILIEGVPSLLRGNSPQCFCLIHPTGNIEILGAADQIFLDCFISCGFSTPQRNYPYDQLKETSEKICEVLYAKGYWGHLTIDFIVTDRSNIDDPKMIIPKLQAVGLTPYYSNRMGNFISLVTTCHGSWTDTGTLISYFDPASRRETWFINRLENEEIKQAGIVKKSSFEPKEFKGIYLEDVHHSHFSMMGFPIFRNLCRSLGMNLDEKKLYGVEMRPTYDKKKIDLLFIKHSRSDCFDFAALTLLAMNLLLSSDSLSGETNMMDIYVGLLFAYREGRESAKSNKKTSKLEKSYGIDGSKADAMNEGSPGGSKEGLDVSGGASSNNNKKTSKTGSKSKASILKLPSMDSRVSSAKSTSNGVVEGGTLRFPDIGREKNRMSSTVVRNGSASGRSSPESKELNRKSPLGGISITVGDANDNNAVVVDGDGGQMERRAVSLEITDFIMPNLEISRLLEYRNRFSSNTTTNGNSAQPVIATGDSLGVTIGGTNVEVKLGDINTELASLYFLEDIYRETSLNLFGYRGRDDKRRPLLQSKSMRNLIQSLWKIADPILNPSNGKSRLKSFSGKSTEMLSRRGSNLRSSFMGSSFLGSRVLSEAISVELEGENGFNNSGSNDSRPQLSAAVDDQLYKDLKSWIQKDDSSLVKSKAVDGQKDGSVTTSLGDLKDIKLNRSKTEGGGNGSESRTGSMAASMAVDDYEEDELDEEEAALYEGLNPTDIMNAIQNFANQPVPSSPTVILPQSDGKAITSSSRRGSVVSNKKTGSISALAKKRGQVPTAIPSSPSFSNAPGTPQSSIRRNSKASIPKAQTAEDDNATGSESAEISRRLSVSKKSASHSKEMRRASVSNHKPPVESKTSHSQAKFLPETSNASSTGASSILMNVQLFEKVEDAILNLDAEKKTE